jgi:hypothetical protein
LHPEIRLIDQSLKVGRGLSTLALRFELTEDSLSRHREHVGDLNMKAQGVDPQELLASLMASKQQAELIAFGMDDPKVKMEALREVRQSTEAIAKLTGAYKTTDPKHLLPFWNKIRGRLIEALAPFPEAREAVLIALEEEMVSGE